MRIFYATLLKFALLFGLIGCQTTYHTPNGHSPMLHKQFQLTAEASATRATETKSLEGKVAFSPIKHIGLMASKRFYDYTKQSNQTRPQGMKGYREEFGIGYYYTLEAPQAITIFDCYAGFSNTFAETFTYENYPSVFSTTSYFVQPSLSVNDNKEKFLASIFPRFTRMYVTRMEESIPESLDRGRTEGAIRRDDVYDFLSINFKFGYGFEHAKLMLQLGLEDLYTVGNLGLDRDYCYVSLGVVFSLDPSVLSYK